MTKSDKPQGIDLSHLARVVANVHRLLAFPEYGLSTWNLFLQSNLVELKEMLGDLVVPNDNKQKEPE